MTVDRKIQTYLLPLWDNTSAWSDLWKKTKIEKSTQEFPIFIKNILWTETTGNPLTTLSELRERWLWSLRSKKKTKIQKIHVRFLFFQKIRNLMRKLFKSMLTTLSELRERWLWSLRSKKDQNSGNPRKIFHFFKNSNSAFSAAKISALNSLWAPRTVQSKLILPRAHLRSKIDQKWTNPYNGEWSKNQWFYTKLQSKISPSSEGVERMDWTCWKLQFFSSKKFGVPIAYNKNQFPREYGYTKAC